VSGKPADERGRATDANDPLLHDVLGGATEAAREAAITDLLATHVYWRVDRILGARFRRSSLSGDHQDDLRAEILLKLVSRLRRLARAPQTSPVHRFTDYVAVVTFNTFDDFVRRAFPERTKLRNRIRYVLRHDERFALWPRGEVLLCGLREWEDQPGPFRMDSDAMSVLGGDDLGIVLEDLFEQASAPLELEWVVSRLATAQLPSHDRGTFVRTLRAPGEDLENLQSLEHLWSEIRTLPVKQRIALLLSARDTAGESVTRYLPTTGIATIRQIAEVLELEPLRFAELWPELPLEDERIAALLEMTRQQVINLRRSARDRLSRRLQRPASKRRSPS
jgi:hypothetical protein